MPRDGDSARAFTAAHVLAMGLAGAAAWWVAGYFLPALPAGARAVLALLLFTLGPGWLVAGWLTRDLPSLDRVIVLISAGVAAAPTLADVLSRVGGIAAFPFIAIGAAAASWRWRKSVASDTASSAASSDPRGVVLIIIVAVICGAMTFGHRLETTPAGVTVYGDYDSVDLSYYAAITAELTHTNPPEAPFYVGHPLNYSYYPTFLLALVHRFADVPILDLHFRWGWPVFFTMAALMLLVFVKTLSASAGAGRLAAILLLLGGDFSYMLVPFVRHAINFDWLLWPTNFLAPTMEVLHFSTWTPALPVMFVALYAFARGLPPRLHAGWIALGCGATAVLVQYKPFAFGMVLAGLGMGMLVARADGPRRHARRFAFAAALFGSIVIALPFLYRIATLYGESRGHFAIDFFRLPRLMLVKFSLEDLFNRAVAAVVGTGTLHEPVVLAAATVLFLAGGLGVRWLGVPGVIRAAAGRAATPSVWILMAWTVLAGVLVPFVLVTEPYQDSLQFYQAGLYVLWIFTAVAVFERTRPSRRAMVVVLVVLLAAPSSIHYLIEKSHDGPNHPLIRMTGSELLAAAYLRELPVDSTVILHDRPQDPSGLAIVSERRVVLAWSRYVTGSDERRDDVDWFFHSADEPDPSRAFAILQRYHVTYVVDHTDRDRLHPAVLAALQPVMQMPGLVLYRYGK
ncbi:MAG TPA: hypothetical protein VG538_03300 [Vicinamibacterales bacterium]|nr:hypothetical protein [Vicinamibacterales bacterium]